MTSLTAISCVTLSDYVKFSDYGLNGYPFKCRIHLPMIFIFQEEVVLAQQSH